MKTLVVFPTRFEAKAVFSKFARLRFSPAGSAGSAGLVGDFFEARAADMFADLPKSRRGDSFEFFVSGVGCAASASAFSDRAILGRADCVLLAGFAGGCNPSLKPGDLVFETRQARVRRAAMSVGARPARVAWLEKIAGVRDKAELFSSSGADAVEMEAQIFKRELCARGADIELSQFRCISDAFDDDAALEKLGFGTDLSSGDMTFSAVGFLLGALRNPGLLAGFFGFVLRAWRARSVYDSKIIEFLEAYSRFDEG